MDERAIAICPNCGAKNRIPANPKGKATCGRCHAALDLQQAKPAEDRLLTLRCSQCRAKNRVPESKLGAGPKCGRCGEPIESKDVNTGRTVMVSDANFDQVVLKSPLPVLLYSWAPWCSVCGTTGPMVEALAGETRGKIRIGKLNTQTNPKLASTYDILSVPTFFIFDGGRLKEQIPGAVPKHELMMKMAHYI